MEVAKFWIEAGRDPDCFEIRHLPGGVGVFATKEFLEGDFLLEYRGVPMPAQVAGDLEKVYNEEKKEFYAFSFVSDGNELCIVCPQTSTPLATQINHGTGAEVNCKPMVVMVDSTPHICFFAKQKITSGMQVKYDHKHSLMNDKQPSSSLWKKYGKAAIAVGTGAAVGVAAIVAAPVVLTGVGFTSAGISAGSLAASMMSSAAVANGGGVAAGSVVAVLQSAGAVGISGTASAVIGTSTGMVAGGLTKLGLSYAENEKDSNDGHTNATSSETGGAKDKVNTTADAVSRGDGGPHDSSHDHAIQELYENEEGNVKPKEKKKDNKGDPKSYVDCKSDGTSTGLAANGLAKLSLSYGEKEKDSNDGHIKATTSGTGGAKDKDNTTSDTGSRGDGKPHDRSQDHAIQEIYKNEEGNVKPKEKKKDNKGDSKSYIDCKCDGKNTK